MNYQYILQAARTAGRRQGQMPQAISAPSSSHERKKRRGYEAALSPRSQPPMGPSIASQERLPPIQSLLPDIPLTTERTISQIRAPVGRESATGPRSAIPARLSPPSASKRVHISSLCGSSNGILETPRQLEDKSSGRSSYDEPSNYRLPIHAGPPSRTSYTASTLGPPPISPYAAHETDTRRGYSHGDSRSVPPPQASYHQSPNGRAYPPSYPPHGTYRNGDTNYGASYHGDTRNGDRRNGDYCNGDDRNGGASIYPGPHSQYRHVQYGYPPPPPPPTNSNYAVHHQYQNGYHHGSVQFENDEPGGQAPRRRRGNLPRDTTDLLKQWFQDHLGHPYPTEDEKQYLCRQTGLQMTQISNWFINARRRRIPELVNQATAETLLRENSGDSNGSSD